MMRPLWSGIVALLLGILGVATAAFVIDVGSYVATLRIEAHEPPLERAAREERLFRPDPDAKRVVPAYRIHASYALKEGSLLHGRSEVGEWRAIYQRATNQLGWSASEDETTSSSRSSCEIVLRDPRPEPSPVGTSTTFELLTRPLFGAERGPERGPPQTETLYFHACDAWTRTSFILPLTARLDAWLSAGAQGTFEERVGSRWRTLPWAILVALAFMVAFSLPLLFRVRVEVGPRTVRVVRRLGPIQRVVAEVLASEIRAIRIVAREVGPFTFHRPTLLLTNDVVVELWPAGRIGLVRAFAARQALSDILVGLPHGEGRVPFRGDG